MYEYSRGWPPLKRIKDEPDRSSFSSFILPKGGHDWLFRRIDEGCLGELAEPFPAQLDADAGLLRPPERDVRSHVQVLVDPDRAGIHPGRHPHRPVVVRGPDRAPQAVVRVVDAA